MSRRFSLWLAVVAASMTATAAAEGLHAATPPPSLLLITLDTTRADAIGAYGGAAAAVTPNLDALAAAGVRYARAVAPSPLTLPSHASLLTGLDPLEHSVRGNGTAALPAGIPTLAAALGERGYATAAFVASRVLDRRFGLDRGFATYDDAMLAERTGEYGYPERPADAVTDAAIAWLSDRPREEPFFLWAHYYDPHAPYAPPPELEGTSERASYLGEVAFVDRQVGRLLAAAGQRAPALLVAAVGDHGEALGEHGERGHGIFLYGATIQVPMIVAGSGVARGQVVEEPVAIRRLAATLLAALGHDGGLPGPPLPGASTSPTSPPLPIFSEATMPAEVYGWAPLAAVTDGRWRFIAAPRPELYDVAADPSETLNLMTDRPEEAARLRAALEGLAARPPVAAAAAPQLDQSTRAALLALGYLEAAPGTPGDAIDPKDGIALLEEFERAKALLAAGQSAEARTILAGLVTRNPSNVPFLSRLAEAELAAGDGEAALATWRRALELQPRSEFLELARADALRRLGRGDEARRALRSVLEIDRRNASAWLGLAGLLAGSAQEELAVLSEAIAAGTDSVVVLLEAARLEAGSGRAAAARALLDRAATLMPGAAVVWLERARLDQASGLLDDALVACRRSAEAEPANPETALCSGRVFIARGEPGRARPHLQRALVLGRGTPVEGEARRLLEAIDD
jgi:arylsulfatase A-like enzyme/Flp pilus assembly protein TadD